jgi:hypothetical protein
MISDLKDVVEGFKEILQYNYSKIVIVALFFSLFWVIMESVFEIIFYKYPPPHSLFL